MSEPVSPKIEETETRQPWQALTFDKMPAVDAETGFTGTGVDNTFYS